MDIVVTAATVVYGAICGVAAAALGWAKTRAKGPGEGFDEKKFIFTVVLGAIVGGIAAYKGWDYTAAETWFTSIGGLMVVELVTKAVWRSLDRKRPPKAKDVKRVKGLKNKAESEEKEKKSDEDE